MYEKLFEDVDNVDHDVMTQQALELSLMAISVILERQCADQLPGGKYWKPTTSISQIATNVPTTNKASESDFAILDMLVRSKPSSTIQTLQTLTMWMRNDTVGWLDEKSYDDKNKLFDLARKLAPIMKNKYVERNTTLKKEKEKKLLKKQELKKETEEKEIQKRIDAANALLKLNVSVWNCGKDLEDGLEKCSSDEERCSVLIAQINFYRHALNIKCPAKLYHMTKVKEGTTGSRRKLTHEELKANYLEVIKYRYPVKVVKPVIVSEDVRKAKFDSQKEKLHQKLKETRLKPIIEKQRSQISSYVNDPHLLVGKNVRHKVKEDGDERVFWSAGKVVELIKLNDANKKRSEYLVEYEEETEQWRFPLLVDLEKGDLIVL